MRTVRIDFETRSQCDLKAAGAWKYSRHPSTEVLCYATMKNDETPQGHFVAPFLELYGLDVCNAYTDFLASADQYEAHNVGFELAIWENIMTPRYGWPKPDPERFFCSAAKAAAHGLPRDLDGAARAMGLSVEKDKKGHSLMLKLSKPRPAWKRTGKGRIYFGTTEEFERLLAYCVQDVRTEHALSKSLRPLSDMERATFLLDLKINRRGVHFDRKLANRAMQLNRLESNKGNKTLALLTNDTIQTIGQTEKIRDFLYERFGFVMDNMRAETVDAVLQENMPDGVRPILELRQRHAKSSVKKYTAMIARASDDDDRIRETLLFHGAHTGRWTGLKIQPHNYPRPKLDRVEIENLILPAIFDGRPDLLELYRGSVSSALSDALRSTLTAAPGHELIGADYSQIEARVLMWLAGETKGIELFANNAGIYEDMAATIYNVPVVDVTKEQRQVGKNTVLGCGYQMGAPRFVAECAKRGITISLPMAESVIEAFRTKYARVKSLWYHVHETALKALSRDTKTTQGLPLTFGRRGSFLFFKLPSGRYLAYKDPQIRRNQFGKKALSHMHVHPKTKKWVRTTTYGGALVENIVQAIARDIMAYSMHLAESRGYRIVMSVHDELVAEVLKGFGSISEFERILCDSPDWAKGCPIAAEGWKGERYRK